MDTSIDIMDFDPQGLVEHLTTELGLKPYTARQLIPWLYRRRVRDFSEMTDIGKAARETLSSRYRIYRPKLDTVQQSKDGTRKYLFELEDGSKVETVLIKQPKRYTLCVSSQVGCAIGCKFCRTGLMGLKRNLKVSEIIGQVLAVKDDVISNFPGPKAGEPEFDFYNIVFMGMGEPLHNLDNVIGAVKLLNEGLGLNFSARKITVSTSGLVPAIKKFGESGVGANLAISLNATTNEVRDKIIPINKRWPLEELLEVLRSYPLKHRKRITMEYVMLKGVNDTEEDLRRLPRLLAGIPSKINLIPYNQNTGLGFYPPERSVIDHWQKTLLELGVNATIRWSKGEDISAACGQLATDKI